MTLRILSVLTLLLTQLAAAQQPYRKLHDDAIVVDMHNDVAQRMMAGEDISVHTTNGQSDLPRFREGGVDVEFFSIWVPPGKSPQSYAAQADSQISRVLSFVEKNRAEVGLGRSYDEVQSLVGAGKFVVMMGMEGSHPVAGSLKEVDHFYQRGVRYISLTWNNSTPWATSAEDESKASWGGKRKGLTRFGRELVQHMNRIGMIVDVSHAGERTFWDVVRVSKKPILASHSSAWRLCHHYRNLKDEQLKAIAASGGVVCVNFAPWFIDSTFGRKEAAMKARNKERIAAYEKTLTGDQFLRDEAVGEFLRKDYDSIRPPLSKLIDHIDYIAKLIGSDHVGLGSDFDGISVTPGELDDVSCFPVITRELLVRGYKDWEIKGILGGNVMRMMRDVEAR